MYSFSLEEEMQVSCFDLTWLLFWYSKKVRDFGESLVCCGDKKFCWKWKMNYVIWLRRSLHVFWCCLFYSMMCWSHSFSLLINRVFWVFSAMAIISVAETFSVLLITAALLPQHKYFLILADSYHIYVLVLVMVLCLSQWTFRIFCSEH